MRLFVALDLPWTLRQRLASLGGLGIPGAKWVPPENHHLTLRFIGEAPRHLAEEIDLALAALKVRELWVGVERNPALDHLRGKIETALQRVGLEPERRRFNPHVTLARLDNPVEAKLAAFIQAHNLFRSEPVPVSHFTLFSSLLGKEQSVYTPEVEYALGERVRSSL